MQLEDRPASEKYMKLELEVDFEVELTCRGVRTKTGLGSDPRAGSVSSTATSGDGQGSARQGRRGRGYSLVGKEEVGRLLSSGLNLGESVGF